MVAPCVCVLVMGCDALFGLDSIEPGNDAPIPGDGLGAGDCLYSPRMLLQTGSGSHDPQLTDDRLELFTARRPSGNYEIYRATRTDPSTPFGTGSAVTNLVNSSDDTDPALTADGLMLVFKSYRGSTISHAFQSTRTSRTGSFSTPALVPGLESQIVYGLDLSADGLTIYIDDGAKLSFATRPTRADPFGPLAMISIERAGFPSVSADGLHLFYNAAGVLHRSRPAVDVGFDVGTATVVDGGGADADLTADGTALVLTGGTASDVVYLIERTCP